MNIADTLELIILATKENIVLNHSRNRKSLFYNIFTFGHFYLISYFPLFEEF
uniref:Uncharacterized protein n=1 Tax=Promethearchaeum syntrophicum TaxID=2594042 RepID=A0A5B9DF27_9ARCH|nr:hypothetical protein DSAG12_03550 [Candidatus Prometheoarchaeum syntrophicum]